jgi:hypothetical protein
VVAPTLSPEQRAEASGTAHAALQARKRSLEQIRAGERTVASILDPGKSDPVVAKTKVSALVPFPATPRRTPRLCWPRPTSSESRRVGGLRNKQHDALVSAPS